MVAQPSSRYPGKVAVTSIWNTPERESLRKTVRSFAEREVACSEPISPSLSAVAAATGPTR